MLTIPYDELTDEVLRDAIATRTRGLLVDVYFAGDEVAPLPVAIDPDAELRAQFEAEQATKEQEDFDSFKARSGAPAYKAAAVHIAAEKLGVLTAIETAIDALISQAGDKSLLIWWQQTDTISRGDPQWQQIEAEVDWGKDVTPEALFEMAAQV